ncbi:MAG: hypothetical protein GWN77_09285, partial [Gammaproteobacteria bacterium]|nr:hypothetical protein [Gammaproteobacteria bacterium]
MTQTNSIYGGVNLAPDKKDIHIVKADRKEEILADEVQKKVTSVPVLSPVTISSGNKRYNAVALPGNDTVDVGANRLVETDLLVPILRDREISLVRKYNSFFSPESVFGGSWTLDLPRLEERLQPSKRTGDKITYSIAYQLTSPLNTY